jgi:hypothetical protein
LQARERVEKRMPGWKHAGITVDIRDTSPERVLEHGTTDAPHISVPEPRQDGAWDPSRGPVPQHTAAPDTNWHFVSPVAARGYRLRHGFSLRRAARRKFFWFWGQNALDKGEFSLQTDLVGMGSRGAVSEKVARWQTARPRRRPSAADAASSKVGGPSGGESFDVRALGLEHSSRWQTARPRRRPSAADAASLKKGGPSGGESVDVRAPGFEHTSPEIKKKTAPARALRAGAFFLLKR